MDSQKDYEEIFADFNSLRLLLAMDTEISGHGTDMAEALWLNSFFGSVDKIMIT